MTVDAVVAGAGIWGCTVARRLAETGRQVLVIEKRPVVGGNVRCEIDAETGIEVHSYGSHIFHTHIPEVWQFVNRFVDFNGYQHKVLASHRGHTYYLPLGLALVNKFFGEELKPSEVDAFMRNEEHSSAIFDAFFRGYTSKQWGSPPEEIDPSIIKRVPVRKNYDVNYFNDYWQGIPSTGYNSLFEQLLAHPGITVRCGVGLELNKTELVVGGDKLPKVPVYYSGPIDALFEFRFGELPWRSLRFETEKVEVEDFQGTSVVNYTDAEVPYTRIHEFKHYHPEGKLAGTWGFNTPKTVVTREYPVAWKCGDEPYYPIDNAGSRELLMRYRQCTARIPNLVIGGRMGAYCYFDMDKAIESALAVEF